MFEAGLKQNLDASLPFSADCATTPQHAASHTRFATVRNIVTVRVATFSFEKVVMVMHVTYLPLPHISENLLCKFGITDQNWQLSKNNETFFCLKSVVTSLKFPHPSLLSLRSWDWVKTDYLILDLTARTSFAVKLKYHWSWFEARAVLSLKPASLSCMVGIKAVLTQSPCEARVISFYCDWGGGHEQMLAAISCR